MGSIFTTTPGNTVKGFGGRIRPIPFYLQFVPGFVVEVVHSEESVFYNGDNTINTIIALPHIHDKTLVTKALSTGENYRYYPLLRTLNDVPTKGDPVLLCTIGKVNYYLGPLNTANNSPTWNDDPSYKPEFIFNKLSENNKIKITNRGKKGESLNFNKDNSFSRMAKYRKPNLDYGTSFNETTGDTIIEGRHGNSLRIGSRSNKPYVFLSNNRGYNNAFETTIDGSLISITSTGTLREHFGIYTKNQDGENELRQSPFDFVLASDSLEPGNEKELNRYMGTLVSSVNNNQNADDLIYKYNNNQMLLHSDRITLNSKIDDIYLSSVKDIHIGTQRHLTISTNNDLIISSERTYIGNPILNNKSREMESMVLGDQLKTVLTKIVGVFKKIKIASSGQPAGINTDPTYAAVVEPELDTIIDDINKITSTKHFIEPNT